MGRFLTWKKLVQNMGCKKTGCKEQGHCYSKTEKVRLPLFFLNNNDPAFRTLLFAPCFLHPAFFNPYFGLVFKGTNPKEISGPLDKLE